MLVGYSIARVSWKSPAGHHAIQGGIFARAEKINVDMMWYPSRAQLGLLKYAVMLRHGFALDWGWAFSDSVLAPR
jgi:hypothetical protein